MVNARTIGYALKTAAVVLGAVIATMHAHGTDVSVYLDCAEAAIVALAAGQHMPTPESSTSSS